MRESETPSVFRRIENVSFADREGGASAIPSYTRHAPYSDTHPTKQPLPVGGSVKRSIDIISSTVALIFLAPLLIGVWLYIRLETPGTGFFRQRRGGYGGKPFYIYKFRTMVEDCGTFRQAEKGDPRVTRSGRFLRKLSIDELPQLINVFKGDMSLVGPRPHAVDHDREFMEVDGRYEERFKARPGITGLAQVSGSRGLTDTDEKKRRRIDLDLDYIDNWSLAMDLKIAAKSLRVLLGDMHAH